MKALAFGAVLLTSVLPSVSHACDFSGTPGSDQAQAEIVAMVRASLSSALAARGIQADGSGVELKERTGCYQDGDQTTYEVAVWGQLTTARGNVLVLDPLLYQAYGGRTYTVYDREGAAAGKAYSIDFMLTGYDAAGWGGAQAPDLRNAATGVDVIADLRDVPGFKSSVHVEGAL